METSQNNRSIKILSNTDTVQAVLHGKLNMVQAAFYQAAELKITPTFSLKMDSQGMVMARMEGNRMKAITVADPSRKLRRISVTVPGIYAIKKDGLICLPNNQLQQTILLIDLPQGVYAGKSVNLQL
jgi:chondroitin AC lyase